MDGWMDGWIDRKLYFITVVLSKLQSILVFTKVVQIVECIEFTQILLENKIWLKIDGEIKEF